MTLTADLRTDAAAPCSPPLVDTAAALLAAAERPLPGLERGRAIDAGTLRAAMAAAFGGSDAEGAWSWKLAYDAGEAAQVLFLRRFGPAMLARAARPGGVPGLWGRPGAVLARPTP
ncbi:hypothetical protein, partial [Azospirillum argentinense]|uniref:hypothetical protein n=1 Tax=Azospirillum argentinense TaxID=2970906 RepID=UPI001FFF1206